jgi:hypothetical protein
VGKDLGIERMIMKLPTASQFKRMGKSRKATLIAEDVIAQVQNAKYKLKRGSWIEISPQRPFEQVSCVVCGVGACVVSISKITDKVRMENGRHGFLNFFIPIHRASTVFDDVELIETAFECGKGFFNDPHDCQKKFRPFFHKAVKFGKRYRSNRKRLIAIMRNIIRNKGRFCPQ